MSKHTQGKWQIYGSIDEEQDVFQIESEHGYSVADVRNYSRKEENKANARLIAAGPELLSALRDCIASLGGINSDAVPETARAAIAKATND